MFALIIFRRLFVYPFADLCSAKHTTQQTHRHGPTGRQADRCRHRHRHRHRYTQRTSVPVPLYHRRCTIAGVPVYQYPPRVRDSQCANSFVPVPLYQYPPVRVGQCANTCAPVPLLVSQPSVPVPASTSRPVCQYLCTSVYQYHCWCTSHVYQYESASQPIPVYQYHCWCTSPVYQYESASQPIPVYQYHFQCQCGIACFYSPTMTVTHAYWWHTLPLAQKLRWLVVAGGYPRPDLEHM